MKLVFAALAMALIMALAPAHASLEARGTHLHLPTKGCAILWFDSEKDRATARRLKAKGWIETSDGLCLLPPHEMVVYLNGGHRCS